MCMRVLEYRDYYFLRKYVEIILVYLYFPSMNEIQFTAQKKLKDKI